MESEPRGSSGAGVRRGSESGDTLIEVLIALVVLGLASVALLIAFATSISASSEHRNLATYNSVLTAASQAVISAYQSDPTYFQCPSVTPAAPTLPSPYAADTVAYGTGVNSVQYWNGTAFTPTCIANAPQEVTISVNGIPSSYTNTFVVYPLSSANATANTGTATSIIFARSPGSGISGIPLGYTNSVNTSQPVIELLVGGGPDANDLSPISFTLNNVSGSAGTLSGCSPSPGNPSLGYVSFSGCVVQTVGNATGTFTLTASTPAGLTSAPSAQFTVGPPSYFLSFSQGGGTQPSARESGNTFATSPTVAVVNASNSRMTSWSGTITFTVSGGVLTCPGTTSTTTVTVSTSNGLATLPASCTFAGGYIYDNTDPNNPVILATPYTFTATATGSLPAVPATSNTFSVSKYGPATQLVFSAQPSGVDGTSASAVFPGQPVVTVEDSFGNVVNTATAATNPVTLTITGGEILGGCTQNWSLGVDTFSGCHGSAYATGLKLVASSTGLTSATSTAFNISGAATHLVFITQPKAGASGAPLTTQPVIAFEDSSNQVVTSSTSAITLTSSGGSLTLCTGLAPVLGVATLGNCTFTGLVNTPYTLTATATNSLNQVITGTSSAFTPVSPGVPSQLVFTTQPIAGNSESVFATQPVISVEDAGGNVVTTSTMGVTLAPSAGTLLSCSGLTAVAGVINVANCTFAGVVGTQYSLTASPTSGSLPSATSGFFSPTGPGAVSATTSTVVASPPSVIANGIATSTVTVTLEDSYGNVVPGKSVILSAGGGNSTINVISATTDTNGVATFTVADLNPESVVYSATDATDSIALNQTATVQFISHPTVTSTSPTPRGQGAVSQTITINGSGFINGASVAFSGTGITVNSTTYVSPIALSANISIASNASTGARNVTVTNPDSGTGTGTNVFTVTPGPIVTSTLPLSRDEGAVNQTVTINGSNFVSGATVAFSNSGIAIVSSTVTGTTSITAVISIASNAPTGAGNVTVTNPDGGTGTGTDVFTVNGPPTVTSTSPSSRGQGAVSQTITINGTNFVSGASLAATFSNPGITVNSTNFVNSTSITATITISGSASTGAGNVTVTNGDGTTVTGTNVFTVNAAPTVTSTSPSSRGQGAVSQTITINGSGFFSGASLAATFSNPGITVNSTNFVNSTSITANITISGSATTGAGNVTITNADAGVGTGTTSSRLTPLPRSPPPARRPVARAPPARPSQSTAPGSSMVPQSPSRALESRSTPRPTRAQSHFRQISRLPVMPPPARAMSRSPTPTVAWAPGRTPSRLTPPPRSPRPLLRPVARGPPANITINGSNFVSGATVAFSGTGITVNSTTFVNATTIKAYITISGSATTGAGNVTVTNTDGGTGTGTNVFTVNAAPTVTSTTPSSRGQGAAIQLITINGSNFVSGATVAFSGIGITVNSTTFVNANTIQAYVTVSGSATTGAGNVTVTNTDGGTGTGTNVFTVNAAPTVTSTSPSSRGQGAISQTITINGTNFVSGASLAATFSNPGITVNSTTYVSSTSITANITISGSASTGAGNVTVTNGDAGVGTGTNVFTVNAAPTVTSTSPSSRGQGAASQTITINGTGFINGASVAFSGTGITVNSTTYVSSTSLTATITISGSASTGARNVTVTNPDGGTGTGTSVFTVDPWSDCHLDHPVVP